MQRATRRQVVRGMGGLGLSLLTGCTWWPGPGARGPKVYQVGYLDASAAPQGPLLLGEAAFREGLRDAGYVEGQNLTIHARYADGQVERLPDLATELVRLPVDVIVAAASAAPLAAKQITSTLPIVMGSIADPMGTGLIQSLSHPGGNVTGVANLLPELSGKRLSLLLETRPALARVAILWTAANPGTARSFRATQVAAESLGMQTISLEAQVPDPPLETMFEAAVREHADSLVVEQDPLLGRYGAQIAHLAAIHGIPAIYSSRPYVVAGGLMAYGADVARTWYRAAYYVDKILKGTKPAELPVEQPREFDLVINLRTAQALGLTIPPSVLLQATEVIQ